MAETYFAQVAQVAAKCPTILGHINLITKLNARNRFFGEEVPRYKQAALGTLRAADPSATLLEVNTRAVARGYRAAPYPALFLLREWRTMGGRIIVTADAHSVGGVVFGYERAIAHARAAGFDRSVLLTQAGAVDCPLRWGDSVKTNYPKKARQKLRLLFVHPL